MKHLKKINEFLDPMGKWTPTDNNVDSPITSEASEEDKIVGIINSGKKINVKSVSNFKSDSNKISFDAVIHGVWMKGDDIYQIRALLKNKYPKVSVDKKDGHFHIEIIKN